MTLSSKSTSQKLTKISKGQNNEQLIQSAFRNSHLLVLSIDNQGIITNSNQGLIRSLKKQEDQIIGLEIFDVFEFDLDENNEIFLGTDVESSFEAHVIRQSWPKLTIRFDTIIHKNKEEYTGLTLVGENITEQENAKKALEKSNDQLNELFDNSNDLIQIFNNKGQILFTNQAWKIRLGYSNSDISQLKLKDVIHQESLHDTGKKLKSIEKGENYDKIETVLVSKYGKKIYVTGNISCTYKQGQSSEFRAIFFDITERIRAERAQALYYKIANLTIRSSNLEMLYSNVFILLQEVLGVKNMTVTLKKADKSLEFTYFINELINQPEIEDQQEIITLLSNYTFERKKPLIIYDDGISKIAGTKNLALRGIVPKIWMGVPIESDGSEIGVISIHANEERQTFNFKDLELLDFIASQISLAIERKWNEAKINSQGARIRAIFESTSHQIWSLDRNLSFTSYNQNCADAMLSYYGATLKLGIKFDQIVAPNFKNKSKVDWVKKYMSAFNGEEINFQTSITDKDGNKVWRNVFLSPIYLPDGSIEEISAIANDITEKKLSEFALQESEEKFRNIFESFQDIYFRCDINGILTLVSPSVTQLLGFQEKDYLQQHITNFFKSNQNFGLLHRLFKNSEVRNFDAIAQTKNGDEVKMLCNVRLIYKNKKAIGIEGVARDITKLKNATDELMTAKVVAERSLKIKERFLANMSHEIRTPMNGIIGMIDLIASTRLNKEQLEYIKTIKKSSDTLLNILNDILDLSKIEAGKMELRKKPINLTQTIEKLYALYSQEAHRNQTSLYYNIDDSIPELNMIDETRLLQVLSNLTSNAIKFSDGKGNINISVRLIQKLSPTKNQFKAEIKDAGIGISKENIKKLFETFSQIDNSFTKNYSGTGLGLAISKELVKSMNGKIGVASTPGLGSTFWFTFEADQPTVADLSLIQIKEEPTLKKQFVGVKPKILLVDDNSINRRVASQILKKSGCDVRSAESGKKAIALVEKNNYDLIFMDIQMPNMDGVEATKHIKNLVLETYPPIVAMTAYSLEEDRVRFITRGLDDYIAKPIKAHILIQKVKEWIGFDAKIVKSDILTETSNDLIINQNTLYQLFKYGGEDIIKSVLEEFDSETNQLLKSASKFAKEQNIDEVRTILHTLKGNSSTLGIEKLWRAVEKLEQRLKEKDNLDIEKELQKVTKLFNEYKKNYKSIVIN